MTTEPPDPVERPRRSPEALSVDIDGRALIYGTRDGRVLLLDEVSSLIWSFLDGDAPAAELADDLAAGFGAPTSQVAGDLATLIESLQAQGLLAGSEPAIRPESEPPPIVLADPPAP